MSILVLTDDLGFRGAMLSDCSGMTVLLVVCLDPELDHRHP
jgi:hypothetical protein